VSGGQHDYVPVRVAWWRVMPMGLLCLLLAGALLLVLTVPVWWRKNGE